MMNLFSAFYGFVADLRQGAGRRQRFRIDAEGGGFDVDELGPRALVEDCLLYTSDAADE